MQFNLNNIVDDNEYKQRFMPGIHEIEILSFAEDKNKNDKPFLGMVITDLTGTKEHMERMYLTTDKAINSAMIKIREIYEAVYGKGGAPENDFSIDQMNAQLGGRKLRIKLNGEEYMFEGNVYTRPGFPYRGFSESINTPLEQTSLRMTDRDIKKLPVEADQKAPVVIQAESTAKTGLNFG